MADDAFERGPLMPPHETWQDYAHQAGMKTVNALTVGAGGTILSMIVGPPLSKRRQEFDQEVASRIEELERQGRVDREILGARAVHFNLCRGDVGRG